MRITKKFTCVLLVLVFTFGIITSPVLATDEIKVMLNGTELSFDVPPQMIDDHIMVPMQVIFEALGADVYWIDFPYTEQMIFAVKNEIKILMAIDQNDFIKFVGNDFDKFIDTLENAQPIARGVPPQLIDGRTLVPLRAISEALDVNVEWEERNQTVVLNCDEKFIDDTNTDKNFYDGLINFITEEDMTIVDDRIAETEGIRVYGTDYIKEYKNTLNVMFDNEWTVKSIEEKYEEHEPMCIHIDTRPEKFIEWTIEYFVGNREPRTFVFDNRQSLSSQIENYVKQYIADYYQKKFMMFI